MKRTLMATLVVPAAMAALAMAQSAPDPGAPMGRGRGGAPYAWNDKDKDGICDITGQPVSQGRGAGMAGQGRGRGFIRGRAARQQAQPDAAQ